MTPNTVTAKRKGEPQHMSRHKTERIGKHCVLTLSRVLALFRLPIVSTFLEHLRDEICFSSCFEHVGGAVVGNMCFVVFRMVWVELVPLYAI